MCCQPRHNPSSPIPSAGGFTGEASTASIQWVIASIPVAAVNCDGRPSVSSGSQIESFGRNLALAKVSLRPSLMLITNPREASLPVPAVVGIAMSGATPLTSLLPPCSGSYWASGPPLKAISATALPKSIGDPPPIHTTPSQLLSL